MRWTNSWGRGAQPERWSRSGSLCAEVGTGRAVLSPRPFPRSGSLPPLRFGQFFLDAEHSCIIECQRRYAPRLFGFISECCSASLRKQRSASPESSREYKLWGRLKGAALYGSSKAGRPRWRAKTDEELASILP